MLTCLFGISGSIYTSHINFPGSVYAYEDGDDDHATIQYVGHDDGTDYETRDLITEDERLTGDNEGDYHYYDDHDDVVEHEIDDK